MSEFRFKFSTEPSGVVGEKVVSNQDVRSRATGCGSDQQAPELEEWVQKILNDVFPGRFEKPRDEARKELSPVE